MKKNFLSINIAKLPVCTTEQGVEIIKSSMGKLSDWNNLLNLIPSNFKKNQQLKRSGVCGIFSGAIGQKTF